MISHFARLNIPRYHPFIPGRIRTIISHQHRSYVDVNNVKELNVDSEEKKNLFNDSCYKFVKIYNPRWISMKIENVVKDLSSNEKNDTGFDLKGLILISSEGINCSVSGMGRTLAIFWKIMSDIYDINHENAEKIYPFQNMDPKRTCTFLKNTNEKTLKNHGSMDANTNQKQHFKFFKVKLKKEIVPLGFQINEEKTLQLSDNLKSKILSPEEFRKVFIKKGHMNMNDDTVLIDNRNDFEYKLGTFVGAINPHVEEFKSFGDFVEQNISKWKGKKIGMFCTGGIRCEKTAIWMKQKFNQEVYQLEGGIINYFANVKEADEDFIGKCFVFDKRETVDVSDTEFLGFQTNQRPGEENINMSMK